MWYFFKYLRATVYYGYIAYHCLLSFNLIVEVYISICVMVFPICCMSGLRAAKTSIWKLDQGLAKGGIQQNSMRKMPTHQKTDSVKILKARGSHLLCPCHPSPHPPLHAVKVASGGEAQAMIEK